MRRISPHRAAHKLGLILAVTTGILAFQAVAAALPTRSNARGGILEVVTFKLRSGVSPAEFSKVDRAVEKQHVARQHGFVSRETAHGDDGDWLVIVHWRTLKDADASMASFKDAPAAQEFMGKLRAETMTMTRYTRDR